MSDSRRHPRAFEFRGGVRIAGTIVACDAAIGRDLTFLSHASAFGARGRRTLPRLGGARRQILATDTTLSLLGDLGERLRAQALIAAFGRPFALGQLRLELFPSGRLPGAASLLCEKDGRRIVYAGPLGASASVRSADAVCLDAQFGASAFSFPDASAAEMALREVAREVAAAGEAPILLLDGTVLSLAPMIAGALAGEGLKLRAPRAVLDVVSAYRRAQLPTPAVERFAGRLGPNEALLWPALARGPGRISGPRTAVRILVSPYADRREVLAQHAAGRGVVFAGDADLGALLRYVEATGASEIALCGAPGEELLDELRGRGLEAYKLGPPRQTDLFRSG